MRKTVSMLFFVLNVVFGLHALFNGSYFIACACAFFAALCFIDHKDEL